MTTVSPPSAGPIVITPHGGPEELFGLGSMRVENGEALVSMTSGAWLRGEDGTPSAGALGVLLDDVLGQALLSGRPAGHWSVTTELSLDFGAALPLDGTVIRAEGRPIRVDASGGLSQGWAFDGHGATLAVGTTWARFLPGVPEAVLAPPVVPEVVDRGSSVSELLGIEPGPTPGSLLARTRTELANPAGVVHGGVVACLVELAARRALAHPTLPTASVRVVYLRPAVGDLVVTADVQHKGRSLAVAHVVARGASGKPAATATVTCRSPVPAGTG
jgi:uncharacterized protein (TIGR00369 family)